MMPLWGLRLEPQEGLDRVGQVHVDHDKDSNEGGGDEGRCGVEGAVGALEGTAHVADVQPVEGGLVEHGHVEPLRPQRFDDHRLPGSGQVRHREISK